MGWQIALDGVSVGPVGEDGWHAVELVSGRGVTQCRLLDADTARVVLWVGGAGGGWDSPARQLYPRLARLLAEVDGIGSLRVQFRHPTHLGESVHDVLAGLSFLAAQNADRIGLCGHSFGGAVVIRAAALSQASRAVVTLAAQSHGAEEIALLGPHCPVLLIHGMADHVLPPTCSRQLYNLARYERRLVLHDGADHGLDEVSPLVEREVRDWFRDHL